jgi:hypothetical protein
MADVAEFDVSSAADPRDFVQLLDIFFNVSSHWLIDVS